MLKSDKKGKSFKKMGTDLENKINRAYKPCLGRYVKKNIEWLKWASVFLCHPRAL
jgi:hypothetical protein